MDKDNSISSYSNREKVAAGNVNDGIAVYPNPVRDGLLGLQFNTVLTGTYLLKLYNGSGQLIFTKDIYRRGVSGNLVIKLPPGIAKGIYKLEILQPDGTSKVKQVFID